MPEPASAEAGVRSTGQVGRIGSPGLRRYRIGRTQRAAGSGSPYDELLPATFGELIARD